jgi:FolB domain-containing protein
MFSIVVPYSTDRDSIIVSELSTKATFTSGDRWSKPRPQPITISLYLETALAEAGASDDVAHTVNYGTLTTEIERLAGEREYGGLRELADILVLLCWTHPRSEAARVDIIAPNVFLRADALGVTLFRERNGQRIGIDQMWIKSLRAACIIGVNEPERVYKQNVEVDVTFDDPGWIVPDWRKMHDTLINV